MAIVHEFTIKRQNAEIELKASFIITPVTPSRRMSRSGHRLPNIDEEEGGHAELDGEIFLVDGGLPWDGRLTSREKDNIEKKVYETYSDSEPPNYRRIDDSYIVDSSFDDFDDSMALKVAGRGEMFW
jgi:hypothetical protein